MNGLILTTILFSHLIDKPAYLDPGSGSFILQLILATLLGGFLILRSYWSKVKEFLVGIFNRNPGEDENDEHNS